MKSRFSFFKALKNSVLFLSFSGCNTGMLFSSAKTLTAVGVIIFFLPIGLSG
jgi:hypothetical protein